MTPYFPSNHVLVVKFSDVKYEQYVKKHDNGTFSTILNNDRAMEPRGLPKEKVHGVFDRPAETHFTPTHQTPWRPHHYREKRLIPKGTVWKLTYEISHAPTYYIEHDNGLISGMFAPTETVASDPKVPFGESREQLLEWKQADYVTVTELDKDNTPWRTTRDS